MAQQNARGKLGRTRRLLPTRLHVIGIVPRAPRGRASRISVRLRHLSRAKPALAVGLARFADRRPNDVRSPGARNKPSCDWGENASKFGAAGRPLRVL
jgi:hypothetical protein